MPVCCSGEQVELSLDPREAGGSPQAGGGGEAGGLWSRHGRLRYSIAAGAGACNITARGFTPEAAATNSPYPYSFAQCHW